MSLAALAARADGAPTRPYRTAAQITELLAHGPHAGECERCHVAHSAEQLPHPFALIGPDDNALCQDCHAQAWTGGSYPNPWIYSGSSHGSSASMVWPGPNPPARVEPGAAGKCVNCHDPHGVQDAAGDVPFLAQAREEVLCNTCHDGNPASTNVQADFRKAFRHPAQDYTGRHRGPTESLPSDFGAAPENRRHAECEDCHNPHVAYRDPLGVPLSPSLSKVNLGVGRVRVQNGGAGIPPAYTFASGSDTLSAPIAEYQLCFKCHSSWTIQPSGQTDLALVLNPANPSFHPVEAQGNDPLISPTAFQPGWSASSLTRCGDCHGSDFDQARGPHGSSYRYILRHPYTASAQPRTMTSDELCFSCHSYEVYANPAAAPATLAASRFNPPGAEVGHAKHVGEHQVPCYGCHVTHGSTTQKHLIAAGRSPGIATYTETASGGSCTPTCHGPSTYTVNYAR